jgi:hypothetical protein
MGGLHEWAAFYRGLGLNVVPGRAGEKRPVVEWKDAQNALIPAAQFEGWFGPGGEYRETDAIGFLTGACSRLGLPPDQTEGLFLIDLDVGGGKDGVAAWNDFVENELNGIEPETWTAISGGGGVHKFFLAPPGWVPPTFKAPPIGVDIRGQGGYAVAAPSMHASGKRYRWVEGQEPSSIPIAIAPPEVCAWVNELREKHARHAGNGIERVPVEEVRNKFGSLVDGREDLMTRMCWGAGLELKRELPELVDPTGHPKVTQMREEVWGRYLREVGTRIPGVGQEAGLEREGRGRAAFETHWDNALRQWGDKLAREAEQPKPDPRPKDEAAADTYDPWGQALPPGFPINRLPADLSNFVEGESTNIGCDPAGLAMAALSVYGSALDLRFKLRMTRHAEWHVPPRIWALLVGPSGAKKTPIITAAVGPLAAVEHRHMEAHARDYARYKEATAAGDKDQPKPPPATRFIIRDTTPEAAAAILSHQDCGILTVQDEAGGFLGSFDRYQTSDNAGRAFWLKAYDGGAFSIDRKTEGATIINNLCAGFLGGIQPQRFAELQDLSTDGILQRFNPTMLKPGRFRGDLNDALALRSYSDAISYVSELKPYTLKMTDDALAFSENFHRELFDFEQQTSMGEDTGFGTWLAKLPGTHGSLALILQIAANRRDVGPEVGLQAVEDAAAIIAEFLIPHASIFYREVVGAGAAAQTRAAASHVLTSGRDRFTYSDLRWNAGLKEVANTQQMANVLTPLVAGGWLGEDVDDRGGRVWVLREGVRELFAGRREIELQRKVSAGRRFKPKDSHDGD